MKGTKDFFFFCIQSVTNGKEMSTVRYPFASFVCYIFIDVSAKHPCLYRGGKHENCISYALLEKTTSSMHCKKKKHFQSFFIDTINHI